MQPPLLLDQHCPGKEDWETLFICAVAFITNAKCWAGPERFNRVGWVFHFFLMMYRNMQAKFKYAKSCAAPTSCGIPSHSQLIIAYSVRVFRTFWSPSIGPWIHWACFIYIYITVFTHHRQARENQLNPVKLWGFQAVSHVCDLKQIFQSYDYIHLFAAKHWLSLKKDLGWNVHVNILIVETHRVKMYVLNNMLTYISDWGRALEFAQKPAVLVCVIFPHIIQRRRRKPLNSIDPWILSPTCKCLIHFLCNVFTPVSSTVFLTWFCKRKTKTSEGLTGLMVWKSPVMAIL